jgi:hypothetical protein
VEKDEEDFTAGNKDASMGEGADGVDIGEGYY